MTLKIKKSELEALLDEVSTDLANAFASEKASLAKALPEESPGETEGSAPEAPPEEGSSPSPKASKAPPAPEAPPEEGSSPSPEASEAPPEAPADPAAEQGPQLTPEVLMAEYSKLPPEELEMHLQAALAAKAAISGSAPAGAPAPAMAPEASTPPAGMPPPTFKSEGKILASPEKANGGLVKSENTNSSDIAELKSLVKSQQEDVENLTKALKLVLETPQRKAITSIAHIAKSAPEPKELTKSVIHARLTELSRNPELKKSDRKLINDFYDGRVKADKLAPLFEDYNK